MPANKTITLELNTPEYDEYIAGASIILQLRTAIKAMEALVKIIGLEKDDMISKKYALDVILKERELTLKKIKEIEEGVSDDGQTDTSSSSARAL